MLPDAGFGVLGALLKGVGIVIMVGGFVGMIAGGVLFLFGQQQVNDSDDHLLFSDPHQAEDGHEAAAMGASVFGTSLMVAGLGLALLVVGIILGPKGRAQQQQQQVVILTADPTRVQPPQMRQ